MIPLPHRPAYPPKGVSATAVLMAVMVNVKALTDQTAAPAPGATRRGVGPPPNEALLTPLIGDK